MPKTTFRWSLLANLFWLIVAFGVTMAMHGHVESELSKIVAEGGVGVCSNRLRGGRMIMKVAIIAGLLVFLSGCAWVDKPTKLTTSDYMVVAGGNYRAWSEIKKDCYEEAEAFCHGMEKEVETVNYATHGVRGWSPQEAELTFKCVNN